jgi:ABC-2 type transport system ATP-binding protein
MMITFEDFERAQTLMGAIQARDLVRTYKTSTGIFRRRGVDVQAVAGVSFEVADGELFGLLGPNGAGKTTTIKMLITLLIPTSGSASVLGYDVVREAREVRKRIGYVFGGDRGLYERLSALDNLRYFAELYAVPPAEQKRRIAELLDLVGLAGREKERVEGYSRGMRQRLHIARGLLHDPPVVFLDEPTIGVDPVGARELRRTIAGLTEAGKTVLLTTHYMFEADDLCDRMAVIAKGEIVAEGTAQDLKAIVADRTVIEIETFGVDDDAGRPRTPGGRGHLGLDRGARPGAGAARAVTRGNRADPAAAGVARHDPHRTSCGARADARGRLRGARRPGRMIVARLRPASHGGNGRFPP